MMKIWALLLLLPAGHVLAQATDGEVSAEYFKKYMEQPKISKKYIRGPNLIYDCEFKHYACINKETNIECTKESRCIKIKTFETQKECFELHTSLQEKTKIESYCKSI